MNEPRLEPISAAQIAELGLPTTFLEGLTVYGILRRHDLGSEVLFNAAKWGNAELLRLLKSRRWDLPIGCPQIGHHWDAVFDCGPYKSHYHGKRDLPGGRLCDICHTWIRYVHILSHPDWDQKLLVGGRCAVMLSDIDPKWAEKKLAAVIAKEKRARLERQLEEERQQREAERQRQEAERERIRVEQEQQASFQAEVQHQAQEKREADEIAAAMLSHYAHRGEQNEHVAGPVAQPIAQTVMQNSWAESTPRQKLRSCVLLALRGTLKGNCTFQTFHDGVTISGTVYKRDGAWKHVWQVPMHKEFSDASFAVYDQAVESMIDNLLQGIRDYKEIVRESQYDLSQR